MPGKARGTASAIEDGWLEIELTRRNHDDPDIADDEIEAVLSMELHEERLAEGETISFSGTNELFFESPGGTPPTTTTWTADGGADRVRDVWVRLDCFCDQRESASQGVSGTLTVSHLAGGRINGDVEVDVEGVVPGFALGPARADARATFDLDHR